MKFSCLRVNSQSQYYRVTPGSLISVKVTRTQRIQQISKTSERYSSESCVEYQVNPFIYKVKNPA